MRLYYFIVFVLLLSGCKDEPKQAPKPAGPPTQKVFLEGETASLRLPLTFKRSSRYLLERDIPAFQKNQFALWLFQQRLERMEFQDSDIDVFVDTTSELHLVVILNVPFTPVNKAIGNSLNGQINQMWRNLQAASGNAIQIEKAGEATIRGEGKVTILKFKHRLTAPTKMETIEFHSVYVVASDLRTLIVLEVSEDEKDIEKYLLTLAN